MSVRGLVFGVGAGLLVSGALHAQQFNGGIPAGWTCTGVCGTLGANGDVPLAPGGGTKYGYVTTTGGVSGVALSGVGGLGSPTNGSQLRSTPFTVNTGDVLAFSFDYVTSDGSGFADYAWARLLDPSFNQVAILFTARTAPSGSIVPGFSMPAPAATLNPPSVPIIAGATNWSPLDGSSSQCYALGCGNTGWITALFTIAAAGSYVLEFGVTNWSDQAYDTGMAFDGLALNGTPIGGGGGNLTVTPEPTSVALVGTGIGLVGLFMRRRRRGSRSS